MFDVLQKGQQTPCIEQMCFYLVATVVFGHRVRRGNIIVAQNIMDDISNKKKKIGFKCKIDRDSSMSTINFLYIKGKQRIITYLTNTSPKNTSKIFNITIKYYWRYVH